MRRFRMAGCEWLAKHPRAGLRPGFFTFRDGREYRVLRVVWHPWADEVMVFAAPCWR